MMRQRSLLFERLEVAEAMRTFISHRMSGSEELRAKLEQWRLILSLLKKLS